MYSGQLRLALHFRTSLGVPVLTGCENRDGGFLDVCVL